MNNLHYLLNLKVNTPIGFVVAIITMLGFWLLCYLLVELLQIIEMIRLTNQKIASLERHIDWCIYSNRKYLTDSKRKELDDKCLKIRKEIYEIKQLMRCFRFKDAYYTAINLEDEKY